MFTVLLTGGLVGLVNFGIHAMTTGAVVVITRHIAGRTDDLHVLRLIGWSVAIIFGVLRVAEVQIGR